MWKIGLKFIIGCLCGYLYIKLSLNRPSSSNLEDFILFILHPLRFFLAMLMLFIGLVMYAYFIQVLLYKTFEVWRKKNYWNTKLFIGYIGLLICVFYLINLDFVHALILFSFSFVYGIISMDTGK
jgi:hypothetical protein